MQLNLTTDYAIRAIIHLGSLKPNEIVSSAELAKSINVDQQYLIKFMRKLAKAKIVNRHLGTNGGYSLTKRPSEISMFDIISVMENDIKVNACLDDPENCSLNKTGTCKVHSFYRKLQEDLEESFKNTTIDKFI